MFSWLIIILPTNWEWRLCGIHSNVNGIVVWVLDLRCAKEKKERVHELYLDKQGWSSCFTVRMLYIYVMGESDALWREDRVSLVLRPILTSTDNVLPSDQQVVHYVLLKPWLLNSSSTLMIWEHIPQSLFFHPLSLYLNELCCWSSSLECQGIVLCRFLWHSRISFIFLKLEICCKSMTPWPTKEEQWIKTLHRGLPWWHSG